MLSVRISQRNDSVIILKWWCGTYKHKREGMVFVYSNYLSLASLSGEVSRMVSYQDMSPPFVSSFPSRWVEGIFAHSPHSIWQWSFNRAWVSGNTIECNTVRFTSLSLQQQSERHRGSPANSLFWTTITVNVCMPRHITVYLNQLAVLVRFCLRWNRMLLIAVVMKVALTFLLLRFQLTWDNPFTASIFYYIAIYVVVRLVFCFSLFYAHPLSELTLSHGAIQGVSASSESWH